MACRRRTYHRWVCYCVQVSAVMVHSTITAGTDATVLVEGVCFVDGCLWARVYGWGGRELVDAHGADGGVHDLVSDVRRDALGVILIHKLLYVLIVVVRVLVGAGRCCIFRAVGSTSRSLAADMHLIFCWSWALGNHWAIRNPGIYHGYLAVRLRLLLAEYLLATGSTLLILLTEISL